MGAYQVQFSSVQYGIRAFGKARMHSTPSLRSFPNVAFKTVPIFVICEGCFARQCVCSVISLHSGMFRAIHPQDFPKMDVDR